MAKPKGKNGAKVVAKAAVASAAIAEKEPRRCPTAPQWRRVRRA